MGFPNYFFQHQKITASKNQSKLQIAGALLKSIDIIKSSDVIDAFQNIGDIERRHLPILNKNVLKSIDDVIAQFYYYRCFLVTPNLKEFLKMNVTKKGVKTVMTREPGT